MGQYWLCVNLDKKEFIDPHKLGCGLKLWEQLANHPSTGTALIILCAAMPQQRGGGDLAESEIVGRWAGDRIAFVGDYAEDLDLPDEFKASEIYGKCRAETKGVVNDDPKGASFKNQDGRYVHYVETKPSEYKDVSEMVCKVIEYELEGKFEGDGWGNFKYK